MTKGAEIRSGGDADRRRRARELNALIDAALGAPARHPPRQLAAYLRAEEPAALAERVRRRATRIARHERSRAETILAARDALILALYAGGGPSGGFTAWCDGSSKPGPDGPTAGVGGLLMDPQGRIVGRLSRPRRRLDAFAAEIAALEAVMHAACARGAQELRVFTDCVALQRLWLEQRADARLARVRELARRFRRFALHALPRLHNQPANRLARRALARAEAGRGAT